MVNFIWVAGRGVWDLTIGEVHFIQAVFRVLQDFFVIWDVVAIWVILNDQDNEFTQNKTLIIIYSRHGSDWPSPQQSQTTPGLFSFLPPTKPLATQSLPDLQVSVQDHKPQVQLFHANDWLNLSRTQDPCEILYDIIKTKATPPEKLQRGGDYRGSPRSYMAGYPTVLELVNCW